MNTKATITAAIALLTIPAVMRADEASTFTNHLDKVSYAIGLNIGSNWKRQEVEVNYDYLVRGLKDAVNGQKLLTDEQTRETLGLYQQELMAKQQERTRQASEQNKKSGEAYLAENKKKSGVVVTETGLQYKVINAGEGESPKPNDTVTVNYRGTLVDGTEFDSSARQGKPAQFNVSGVIRGWSEALVLMKPGAKWELAIPAELAYGDAGSPPQIAPGSTLLFEVELVSVQSAPQRAPLTSDIIKVPSLDEMKKGAKIETIKAEDLEKMQKEEQQKSQ